MSEIIKLKKFSECTHKWIPINDRPARFGYRCMFCLGWKDPFSGKEMSFKDAGDFRYKQLIAN